MQFLLKSRGIFGSFQGTASIAEGAEGACGLFQVTWLDNVRSSQ